MQEAQPPSVRELAYLRSLLPAEVLVPDEALEEEVWNRCLRLSSAEVEQLIAEGAFEQAEVWQYQVGLLGSVRAYVMAIRREFARRAAAAACIARG